MATIDLPEKEAFNQQVVAIERRIEGITRSNNMAGLLNNNFKKWLSSSSMSPLKLTEELDTNNDGIISGDEFASLLGKMTGERPPEWVVELVFSFVNADVKTGIPLNDWMAFLAASGLDIPDELFKEKIEVTGSIGILEEQITAGDEISVTVSFNVDVVAYEFSIIEVNSGGALLDLITPNADMDRPDFDEFQIELSTPGDYRAELRHLGLRLDEHRIVVHPRVEAVKEDPVVEESTPAEEHPHEEVHGSEEGFGAFVTQIENVKLRSEAQALIADSPAFVVECTIQSVSKTLLGMGLYRNGFTAHCVSDDGITMRVMLKPCEVPPQAGERFDSTVSLHDWDVALKQLICLEA
ncbi:MAG TPA: hypothetical protein D7H91_06320 [Candidatus Poseidoniales archaeon]|nr:MAG TPA: hypothetical protein D7H91_06320 [Candidatus Poseidoniales archaeon]HII78637.1 hypothetical protein [Poseidonia sp.]|tara:strand:+ start:7225 stop:8283 length:1059 start_codon:yes stop_codon:yes gene_type:complete